MVMAIPAVDVCAWGGLGLTCGLGQSGSGRYWLYKTRLSSSLSTYSDQVGQVRGLLWKHRSYVGGCYVWFISD